MSRKDDKSASAAPQFRVVVTRPHGRGPLGPYRLVLAVAFAMMIAGERLWSVVRHGHADDGALLAAAAAGVFVWIVTTMINNILASATMPETTPPAAVADEPAVSAG